MTHEFHPVARGGRDVPGTLPPTGVLVGPVGARQGTLCTADLVRAASWRGMWRHMQREAVHWWAAEALWGSLRLSFLFVMGSLSNVGAGVSLSQVSSG